MNYEDPNSPAKTPVQTATEGAAQAWQSTKDRATDALQTGERYVRDNPGVSVLGVFGAGLLVGLLLGYTVAHEERDDYAETAREFFKRWGKKLNLD